jgi:molybdate transport system permease protein
LGTNRPAERRTGSWRRFIGTAALSLALAAGVGFLTIPLVALFLRVPYDRLGDYLTRPIVSDALLLSLFTSLLSLALVVGLGTPLAYVLGRYKFRGKRALETLVDLPLVLPPAVAGVALLLAFGRRGLLGPWLEGVGLEIAFSTAAVVLAQAFVAAPLYIGSARSAFESVPKEWEEIAATEGAGRWTRFRLVLLPLAVPGLAGGVAMAWARALGEFGATLLFAGSFQGRTQTMPLAIYSALESDFDASILLSALLVAVSFTLLIVFKLLSSRRITSSD